MKVGFSRIDITPPVGTVMAGQPMNYRAKGIESRLFATAMSLQEGAGKVVLVSCDVLLLANETAGEIRQRAAAEADMDAENVILCTTHTHSGPITQELFGMAADSGYVEMLKGNIVAAVRQGCDRGVEATLEIAQGQLRGYAFNRRFIMSDGGIETHPLKGDPHIVKAEGPDGEDLAVMWAKDSQGKVMGVVVVFGCHATVMERRNELISADYPGKVASFIQSAMGADVPVLFLQGASGNICQVNPRDTARKEVGREWTKVMGQAIGGKAVSLLKAGGDKAEGPIRTITETVRIPRRAVDRELVEWAENYQPQEARPCILSDYGSELYGQIEEPVVSLEQLFKTRYWANFYANEIKTLERDRKRQPEMPLTLKVAAQNNWAMVTLPCELFVEWAGAIRQGSPFEHTLVVELANGWNGYIPTRRAFERKGGYETKEVTSTMLVAEAGDMVLEKVKSMLEAAKNAK